MSPRRDPVPRARKPWHWLGGLLVLGILAAGLVAAALLLWENVDIRRLAGTPRAPGGWVLPDPVPPAGPARPEATFRAALFRSAASARFFPDSAYYPGLLASWERLVAEAGGEAVVVEGAEEVRALDPTALLVAPAAVCLGTQEVETLQGHADRGGGLLLTWATGARDGACEWTGWDALKGLTGALEVRQLDRRPAAYLTVPAGLPLAAGLDPGTRIELRWDAQVALTAGGPRAYWSDWAMNPAPAQAEGGSDAAAWFGRTEGGGRVVWFGFSASQGARETDRGRLEALIRGGILWAAGVPAAEILPWPGGARAALVVAQGVGWEFGNSAVLAAVARERGFPVTFFVLSRMALDFPDLAEVLREAGEVGSQTSDQTVLAGLPYQDQLTRLRRSWSEIRGWAGDSARGLRPPEERFDENTLRAWRALGGTYLVAVNDARGASPELFDTPAGRVALLPRIIKDDYNVLVQEGRMASRHLLEAYLEGMEKVWALGGLALVSVHSQVAGTPRRIGVVGEVADSARTRGGWWLAAAGEVADWWLARRAASVTVLRAAEGLEVVVTAGAEAPLGDAWVGVSLPDGLAGRVPELDGTPVAYRETPWGIAVPLGRLAAEGTRTVVLRGAVEAEEEEAGR